MDLSTGRCPNKKQDCECVRVCANLYGQEVRKVRSELSSIPVTDMGKRERKLRELENLNKVYYKRIYT